MALVVDGGGLVNKGGALGTGAACCCNKCSGPCDGENPCPEGCVCVDGECVTNCTSKSCTLVAAGWPTVVPDGTCQGGNCCCEGLPEGGCFDESILDEEGNPPGDANDWVLKANCENCCENKLLFSVTYPPNVESPNGPARSQEWVENVRDHLLANGWGNATKYHVDCYTGAGPDPTHLSYVRVCCDGTLVCPTTEEDCFAASPAALAPADMSNLQPQLVPSNCFFGALECLPACEPNPLP
jgi:hypothetical protein